MVEAWFYTEFGIQGDYDRVNCHEEVTAELRRKQTICTSAGPAQIRHALIPPLPTTVGHA